MGKRMSLKGTGNVLFALAMLISAPTVRAEAQTADERYFTIDSVQMQEVEVSESDAFNLLNQGFVGNVPPTVPPVAPYPYPYPNPYPSNPGPFPAPVPGGDVPAPGNSGSAVDAVSGFVNLAKSLWDIVVENRPVVNIATDHANALPVGVQTWTDLSNWRAPKGKAYRVTYVNGYGNPVVDFTFRVLFVPGGKFKGKGSYITNATIVPASVLVGWGFKFTANAKVSSITNAGSLKNPMAAMQLDMQWAVDSVLKHHGETQNFYLRGDGMLMNLSDESVVKPAP